ncbi:hypothetical protein GQ43DRAFT_492391 [Delitschia confertaspora ATCC 74209]|uniref:Uncharacterized protein n=1 Tax=Delitschia confertaspora ATCC 74209 TaxID=1513339 RepID=A0A9P4MWI6_9PLEO|nr:hypothetical protein GQ43DRAFT_492391 [Delitschia confertaspora ATCC 74209]
MCYPGRFLPKEKPKYRYHRSLQGVPEFHLVNGHLDDGESKELFYNGGVGGLEQVAIWIAREMVSVFVEEGGMAGFPDVEDVGQTGGVRLRLMLLRKVHNNAATLTERVCAIPMRQMEMRRHAVDDYESMIVARMYSNLRNMQRCNCCAAIYNLSIFIPPHPDQAINASANAPMIPIRAAYYTFIMYNLSRSSNNMVQSVPNME